MRKSSLLLFVLAGATLTLTSSCHSVRAAEKETITIVNHDSNYSVTIDGVPQEVATRDVTPAAKFSCISMSGPTNVTVKKGSYKVVVTGAKSIVNKIRVVSDGKTLSMEKSYPVNIEITVPSLDCIMGSGATNISVEDGIVSNKFEISAAGAANIRFTNLKSDNLTVELAGGSRVSATSITGKKFDVSISGGASISASAVNVPTLDFSVSGGAFVQFDNINANVLEISCSGGSRFECKNIKTNSLNCESSGGSNLTIGGSSSKARLQASGAARINANELKCKNVAEDTSGMGAIVR